MIKNLHDYLSLLRREGELAEIDAQVDPNLEAAEIHRRVIADEGPALLFNNIRGAAFPLATNLFGSQRRIELAFGPRPEQLVAELVKTAETLSDGLGALWKARRTLCSLLNVGLSRRRRAPALTRREAPGLSRLPLLKTWAADGGAFVTLPLVYTEHPATGQHNLGMYRLQRYDDEHTGFHCQIAKGAGFHLAAARERGSALPVNVSIGGPPALILAAIAPLPENAPELILASLVLGRKIPLAANPLGPLPILAESEFVLVGSVDPVELRPEGPFGDHYGYYSLEHDYPVFRCSGVLRREQPICTATVVGKPRQEDFYIGDYLQQLLSPIFPLVMPAVLDLWSYGETGYHSLAAAVVQQRYKREAMVSAFRILGEGQLSLTKFLFVVDRRQDLKSFRSVLEYVLARADFGSDLYVFSNLAMDTLDYTGPSVNEGSKGVLLGVGSPIRELPGEFGQELPAGITKAAVFCRGCLVVEGAAFNSAEQLAASIAELPDLRSWPLIVLVDDAERTAADEPQFLWTVFTRFEPARDITARRLSIQRNHVSYEAPIVIDARMKPGYPDELECDAQTADLVNRRWGEYWQKPRKAN